MAYRKTTLFDVMNTAGQATEGVLNAMTPFMQEATDAKLRNQQITIENWMNDEALKFQNRTDYSNFEDEFNKDYKILESQYQDYRGLYARNKSSELLTNAKLQMGEKIKGLVNNGIRNYTTTLDMDTLQKSQQQQVSQDRLNMQNEVIDDMWNRNLISSDQYVGLRQQYYTQTIVDGAQDHYKTIISSNPDASDAELDALFDQYTGEDFTSSKLVIDGKEVDVAADKQTAIQSAKKNMWAKINEAREANNTAIKDQNTKLRDDYVLQRVDSSTSLYNIEQQITAIENMPNTQLDVDQKRQRIDELYSYYKQLESVRGTSSKPSGGTGSGSTSAKTAVQTAFKYNALVSALKDKKVMMMNWGKDLEHDDGTTMYTQKRAFETVCQDEWNKAVAAVGGNVKDLYYQEIYTQNIQPLIDSWIADSIKGGYIPDGADSIISSSIKEVQKYCTSNGAGDISDSYKNFVYDTLFAMDYKQFNGDVNKIQAEIDKLATQYKDQAIVKRIDALLNPQSNRYTRQDIESYDEKDLATYVKAQQDTLVYTFGDNASTARRTTVGVESQAIWGKGADMMRKDLIMTLGASGQDLSDMKIETTYEPTADGFDINGTLNFTITGTKNQNGTYRYVMSDDGKSVVLQKIPVKLNWDTASKTNQIVTVSRGKYQDSIKAEHQKAEQAHKEETEKSKTDYNSTTVPKGTGNGYSTLQSQINEQFNQFRQTDMPAPPGIDQATWNKYKNTNDAWSVLSGAFSSQEELYKWLKSTNEGAASRQDVIVTPPKTKPGDKPQLAF